MIKQLVFLILVLCVFKRKKNHSNSVTLLHRNSDVLLEYIIIILCVLCLEKNKIVYQKFFEQTNEIWSFIFVSVLLINTFFSESSYDINLNAFNRSSKHFFFQLTHEQSINTLFHAWCHRSASWVQFDLPETDFGAKWKPWTFSEYYTLGQHIVKPT